jgi:DNA-binding IclR family transcriptional regulator
MSAIKTRTVPSLDKALCILELLTHSRAGLTLPELVEQSGLAKSSVHYLLVTLERRGYVTRMERTGRYVLGMRVFSMANSVLRGLSQRQRAAPYLAALRLRTGLTVHMAILEQGEAVLIAKHDGPTGLRLATWIGKQMDLHCTGLGKALIAFLPEAEREVAISERPFSRHNENTITNPKRLRENLELAARNGYALDDEEDELGSRCVGVPIFGTDSRPIASLSVAGSLNEITQDNVAMLAAECKRAAAAISRVLVEPSPAVVAASATTHHSVAC